MATDEERAYYLSILGDTAATRSMSNADLQRAFYITGGGVKGTRQLVLATTTSSVRWRAAADVIVDPVNAAPQITAALALGQVILSPGVFSLTDSIKATKINHGITGQGWETILSVGPNTGKYAVDFVPETPDGIRAKFSNFTIDGRGDTQSTKTGGGIHAVGGVQSLFDFIHFLNCADNGLWLDSFGGNGGGAFGHHNKVTNCLFDATLFSQGAGRGLLLTGSDENNISSEFQFLGGAGTPTFAIRDQSGLNRYVGTVIVGGKNNMGGIELRDGRRSMISNCQFDGVSGDNIFVASSGDHIISNNTFTSVADQVSLPNSDGQFSAIHLEFGVKNTLVSGCIMDSSPTNGRTRSFIRERAMGDSGGNVYTNNLGVVRGTLGGPAYNIEAVSSQFGLNMLNGAVAALTR